jgi:hypothetical protein
MGTIGTKQVCTFLLFIMQYPEFRYWYITTLEQKKLEKIYIKNYIELVFWPTYLDRPGIGGSDDEYCGSAVRCNGNRLTQLAAQFFHLASELRNQTLVWAAEEHAIVEDDITAEKC